MKKLSVFFTLLILCTALFSCANPNEVVPGNATVSGREDLSSTPAEIVETTTSVPMITDTPPITAPTVEKTEIVYEKVNLQEGLCYTPEPFELFLKDVSSYEKRNCPFAICQVTLNSIDLSLTADEWNLHTLRSTSKSSVELTIDTALDKNSYFTLNEGATITIEGNCWIYESEGVLHAVYDDADYLPIAEVGESYIAVLCKTSDSTEDDPYIIIGLSVPIPDENLKSETYFQEYYEKIQLNDADMEILSDSALIHYAYRDAAPEASEE